MSSWTNLDKAMFKKVIFIGSVFLLASSIVACGEPAPGSPSPVPLPEQPPPAAEGQPPEQLPPVDEAANGEEWNTVETFTGRANETTPPFHVSGSEWRIAWAIDAEHPENAVLNLTMYCQDTPYAIWQTVSHSGDSGGDVIYYIPCGGNRDFFVKVRSRNLRHWTITVEDNSAQTPTCPVQITDIHYKGTVYPPEPEECVCFETVEPDEYVVIKNLGDCYQDMSGWVLKNVTKGYPSFTFPAQLPGTVPPEPCILGPHQIFKVYTSFPFSPGQIEEAYVYAEPPPSMYALYPFRFDYPPGDIWDNEEPDVAVLYNAKGEEVSRKSYIVPTENKFSADE